MRLLTALSLCAAASVLATAAPAPLPRHRDRPFDPAGAWRSESRESDAATALSVFQPNGTFREDWYGTCFVGRWAVEADEIGVKVTVDYWHFDSPHSVGRCAFRPDGAGGLRFGTLHFRRED